MSKLIVNSRYGTTPNDILNHKEISLKAKGLYGFLQCKPEEWSFSTDRIAGQLKESQKTIRATLQELERFGLLTRKLRPKDDKGKWTGYDYTLHEFINELPKPSLPKAVGRINDRMDNGEDISKKDYSKQDIVNKKDIIIADKSANDKNPINKALNVKDLYTKMGMPKPIKACATQWQDEALNAVNILTQGEDKRSSIFKCYKDNHQKARIALSDCKELGQLHALYFLKVFNAII